ncbi:hypothetical protein QE152_g38293 [Popillia japonica]|uniref:Transposase n=1 Tax=Popillia japonica TaxID=7064 RepID=A0AAW1I8D0_POPJA
MVYARRGSSASHGLNESFIPVAHGLNMVENAWFMQVNECFIPVAHGLNMVENAWFMQDGARPHRTEEVATI